MCQAFAFQLRSGTFYQSIKSGHTLMYEYAGTLHARISGIEQPAWRVSFHVLQSHHRAKGHMRAEALYGGQNSPALLSQFIIAA